jgi:DNA primase
VKPHFTPEFLKEAKDRLGSELADIIAKTVPLKKVGSRFEACCPFHDDSDPSFNVRDGDSGWHYYCFSGCCAESSGDVYKWLQTQRGMSFHDAVAYVVNRVGMEMPAVSPEQQERHDRLERLRAIVAHTALWFGNKLYNPCGAEALAYLNRRGLDDDAIRDFQLGYSPSDPGTWRDLIADLTISNPRRFRHEELIASGVFGKDKVSGRARPLSYFMNKAIITIRDLHGRPIGFAGRKLGDQEGPKYVNSADCELFSKRRVIYNGDRAARQALTSPNPVVLVEGYFDVMALERAGLGAAVSCMGTSATPEQMEIIWRMKERPGVTGRNAPILCFDGDGPGRNAAVAAATRFLPLLTPERSARFAFLPGAEDPASLLEQEGGHAALVDALAAAIPAPMVVYREEQSALAAKPTPEDYAAFDQAIRTKILVVLKDGTLRSAYKDQFYQLRRERFGKSSSRPEPPVPPQTLPRRLSEPALLAALLNYPELFHDFGEDLGRLTFPDEALDRFKQMMVFRLSLEMDADGCRREVERLIRESIQARIIRDSVLTEAVFTAAPFTRPGRPLDEVRAGIQRLLIDMQVTAIKAEVSRLMSRLDGTEQDRQRQAEIAALLDGLRK